MDLSFGIIIQKGRALEVIIRSEWVEQISNLVPEYSFDTNMLVFGLCIDHKLFHNTVATALIDYEYILKF